MNRYKKNDGGLFVPADRFHAYDFRDLPWMKAIQPVASGGSPAWFDIATVAEADTTSGISTAAPNWSSVTPSLTGSATKSRVYIQNRFGAANVKMALYDNGGAIITGASGVSASVAGGQYLEITFGTPASVTASTAYKLAWQAENINVDGRYLAGAGALSTGTGLYSDFPTANLPTDIGPFAQKWVVSLWVQ